MSDADELSTCRCVSCGALSTFEYVTGGWWAVPEHSRDAHKVLWHWRLTADARVVWACSASCARKAPEDV